MLRSRMRWIASLVVVCLVAATGVRPIRAETRDPHDTRASTILETHGLAPSVTLRRHGAPGPDARLQPFVLTAHAAALIPPVSVTLAAPGGAPTTITITVHRARSSRGPPEG